MIVFPNAKINIGLNITEKRADGFHNIETIFYPIGWNDVLEATKADLFNFQTKALHHPLDVQDNLCIKAYNLLKEELDIPPVDMFLMKNIPMGAGLGGGSANAAFTLNLLNDLLQLGLDNKTLKTYAAKLGSDCAFFIDNKPSMAIGRGDALVPVDLNLDNYQIVIAFPDIHIDTAWAYDKLKPKEPAYSIKEVTRIPIEEWKDKIVNDFEPVVFEEYPVVANLKQKFYGLGAIYASLSGSGSAVYGIFDKDKGLENIPNKLGIPGKFIYINRQKPNY